MKDLKKALCFLFMWISLSVVAQENNWDMYMASYPKGAGSTLLNMDLKKSAPRKALPYLLKTGVTFSNCTADGFPAEDAYSELYRLSDSVQACLSRKVQYVLGGTFTYQCGRFDYFYLSDTTGLRGELEKLYNTTFPGYEPTILIREDRPWEAYLQFLFPREEPLEYMRNQTGVMRLWEAGDNLEKERKVNHFIHFTKEKDRACFEEIVRQEGFTIENRNLEGKMPMPLTLQISRTDKVVLHAITPLTTRLRQLAASCLGEYEGWETDITR